MRLVLDACVLYPTVLRQILLQAAAEGLYEPVWSERILREWVLATARLGPEAELIAQGEAALAQASHPRACQAAQPQIEARLMLPDENDRHVLAVAISAHADAIVTFNAKDFPRGTLAEWGIARRDPDGLLWELLSRHPHSLRRITEAVRARAEQLSGQPMPMRALMRRAKLPRLGKALAEG